MRKAPPVGRIAGDGRRKSAGRGPAGAGALIPRPVAVAATWAAALLLLVAATYVGVRILLALTFVVIPCLVALLLAALLQPLNRGFIALHLHRAVAAGLTMLTAFVAVLGIGSAVVYGVADRFDELVDKFGTSLHNLRSWIIHSPLPVDADTIEHAQHSVVTALENTGTDISGTTTMVASATVRVLAEVLLCLFVLFFLLYDGERMWDYLAGKLPATWRRRVHAAGEAAWVTLTGYVHGTLIIAIIHAIVIGTVLYILGIPVFVPLALLVFLGAFIPIVGALVAGGLAVIITLGIQGLVPALVLLGILLLENELEAHVLQPFVVGRYVRLHPLAIVLVIAAGSYLAGVLGALLSVPALGVLVNMWRPLTGRSAVVVEAHHQHRSRASAAWRTTRRWAGSFGRFFTGGRSPSPRR